ncbi:unnamed protein product [Ectocarpus sp. 12 AP-2014]
MLRVGGPMRVGGATGGTMSECIVELQESSLPDAFKLAQVRSLVRYIKEVGLLQRRIIDESGFEADTNSYLEILCAKEDGDLMRKVSSTRVLRQARDSEDYDEKRLEWKRQKKSVINAIGSMTARTLRFEDKERKTIALHALAFYKSIMATDDGAIPGESESTDSLIEQYKRHRSEISKIPMFADSILKMLKDIRKTVRASSKLQPGSNSFAQFLEEARAARMFNRSLLWWASVVQFLQQSSIVEAEKNAREVMQTLKKLKGKQEEGKKREISRLLSKLDDNASIDQHLPTGCLSEELPPEAAGSPPLDESKTPEETSSITVSGGVQQQGMKRERDSCSSEESELSSLPAPVVIGDDCKLSPAIERLVLDHRQEQQQQQQQQQHRQQQRVSFTDHLEVSASGGTSTMARRSSIFRSTTTTVAKGGGGGSSGGSGGRTKPPALTWSADGEEAGGRRVGGNSGGINPLKSPASGGLRSPGTRMLGVGGEGGSGFPSRVSWEEESQGTAGTMDTAEMHAQHAVSFSGIPDSDDDGGHDGDGDDDDDDDDELFEAADNLDLGAVDLCATGKGADGQTTYKDQDELRLPAKVAGPPQKKGVEQERFSAALDFFRQEQQGRPRRMAVSPRAPSPMHKLTTFGTLPSGFSSSSSRTSPRASATTSTSMTAATTTNPFALKPGVSSGVRLRTPSSRSRAEVRSAVKTKAKTVTRRRMSAERDAGTARDRLLSSDNTAYGRGKTPLARSMSVYIPSSRSQTTPIHRASKTPTVKSSRRALKSPGVRGFTRGAFFG